MSDTKNAEPTSARGGYAFISYARKDVNLVKTVEAYLTQEEISPWRDNQLKLGELWEDVIADRIRQCSVFMIAMSDDARESRFVRQEIGLARAERKPIIPILLNGEPFEELTQCQYVHFSHIDSGGFVEELRDLLHPTQIPSVTVQHRRANSFWRIRRIVHKGSRR